VEDLISYVKQTLNNSQKWGFKIEAGKLPGMDTSVICTCPPTRGGKGGGFVLLDRALAALVEKVLPRDLNRRFCGRLEAASNGDFKH
jgi:hypothetical protein